MPWRCCAPPSVSVEEPSRRSPSATSGSAPASNRLEQLQLGRESLVFGRIDRWSPATGEGGVRAPNGRWPRPSTSAGWRWPTTTRSRWSSTGGRRSPSRSTGRRAPSPMGLTRRRHFLTEGRRVIDLEDELFGEPGDGSGDGDAPNDWRLGSGRACRARRRCCRRWTVPGPAACATSWRPSSGSRTRSSGAR